jgi:hypothetical protein
MIVGCADTDSPESPPRPDATPAAETARAGAGNKLSCSTPLISDLMGAEADPTDGWGNKLERLDNPVERLDTGIPERLDNPAERPDNPVERLDTGIPERLDNPVERLDNPIGLVGAGLPIDPNEVIIFMTIKMIFDLFLWS